MITQQSGHLLLRSSKLSLPEVYDLLKKALGKSKLGIISGLRLKRQEGHVILSSGFSYIAGFFVSLLTDFEIDISNVNLHQPVQIVAEIVPSANELQIKLEPLQPLKTNQVRIWLLQDFCVEDHLCSKFQYSPWFWKGYTRTNVFESDFRLVIFEHVLKHETNFRYFGDDWEVYKNGAHLMENTDYRKTQEGLELTVNNLLDFDTLDVNEFLRICTLEELIPYQIFSSSTAILFHPRESTVNLVAVYSKSKTLVL